MNGTDESKFSSDSQVGDALRELALNLRWSWNHAADDLWAQVEPELWELTQNPWVMLQTVSQEKLRTVASDARFRQKLNELIQEKRHHEQTDGWFQEAYKEPPFTQVAYAQAVFLSDYDMRLTEHLIQGVDLWLNTPRRPWEACGTSGMKILVNGGLNLSELDGWWAEAYAPDVGWALGDGQEHGSDPGWDASEADRLYALLEHEVVPEFYRRDEAGIPVGWVQRMRESMARLTPQFSANRAVREYTEKYYVPLATAYCQRGSDENRAANELLRWQQQLAQHWPKLRFGSLIVETEGSQHLFRVPVYLDELDSDAVRVELYAEPLNGRGPFRQTMIRGEPLIGAENAYQYSTAIPANRPSDDFTPRIIPYHLAASIPLEAPEILWYR
ncbi:MAG TPA: alpha-glucan family phosphorylase [Bryobacteraceae bacterium]